MCVSASLAWCDSTPPPRRRRASSPLIGKLERQITEAVIPSPENSCGVNRGDGVTDGGDEQPTRTNQGRSQRGMLMAEDTIADST
eukprot:scaffold156745_cov32-Tisochrysis_lutea.AAC.5